MLLVIDLDLRVEDDLKRVWRRHLSSQQVEILWRILVVRISILCLQNNERAFVFLPGRTELPPLLAPFAEENRENVFIKSFPGEMNGFHGRRQDGLSLADYLLACKPTELHVVGAYTDACVLETIKDDRLAQLMPRENIIVRFDASIPQSTDLAVLQRMQEAYSGLGVRIIQDATFWQ